jgi:hypothetical protein
MQYIRIHLKNESSVCRGKVSVRAKIILDNKVFGCVKYWIQAAEKL